MIDISTLTGLDGEAFEAERARLIEQHLAALPERQQKAARALQGRVDEARGSLEPPEFARWLANEANEQAENLIDTLVQLRGVITGPPITVR